ncbi:uncharacterized protein V1518DRAFT_393480 [Limtongia smithiae]|uniref:uncharacterized protein n=1 Tax=Limtongia smithiae TaxID=1125753 RepID=UPI0034CE5721
MPEPSRNRIAFLQPRDVPCKFYLSGECRRGASCWFKHGDKRGPPRSRKARAAAAAASAAATTRPTVDAAPVTINSTKNSAALDITATTSAPAEGSSTELASGEPDSEAEEDLNQRCSICLDIPKVYGLLPNCDHLFCLQCIRQWRQTTGLASVNVTPQNANPPAPPAPEPGIDFPTLGRPEYLLVNLGGRSRRRSTRELSKCCPLCRKSSDFVIPSSKFPKRSESDVGGERSSANPAKDEIISVYLKTLKHIPCKYFAKSKSCQFGNDCFYAHLLPEEDASWSSSRQARTEWGTRPARKSRRKEYVFSQTELHDAAARYRRQRALSSAEAQQFDPSSLLPTLDVFPVDFESSFPPEIMEWADVDGSYVFPTDLL